jgi:nanoRNase/pAp phosphatase (c-di-AMP/oligoRNAs hydrolase)
VLQLAMVVEHYGDDRFLRHMVPKLLDKRLEEVAASDDVQKKYAPLAERHQRFVERVREKSVVKGGVVLCDLTDSVSDVIGKFVTYALYPESKYSVIIGLLKNGIKISVGFNPWSGQQRTVDISAICARYGGGGHPVVGGISFEKSASGRAREVAAQIVQDLAD